MATVETFIKAAQIKPDGYLPGGLPFIRKTTLEKLAAEQREVIPMQTIRKATPAPDFMRVVKHAIMTAKTPDEAATIAFRVENILKARVKEDAPDVVARNAKLAWIDGEAKRLHKMGGMSVNAAIDQAQRNWVLQDNSPGQR
jgi:hypothetical protein